MEKTEVISKILDMVRILSPDNNKDREYLELLADNIYHYVLDYCHRQDFPYQLVITAAQLIQKHLADLADENKNLKSLQQGDTRWEFFGNAPNPNGLPTELDLKSLNTKLQLYRKVAWSCRR